MAAFGTDIANRALVHLGQRAISNIDDPEDDNAILLKQHLPQSIGVVLRGHPWNDVYRRDLIGADAAPPAFGYLYRYTLKSGTVRVLRVNEDRNALWKREGAFSLVTDLGPPLKVEWLSDGSDVGSINDPMLREIVALHVAWATCIKVTQDKRLKADLWDEYRDQRAEARSIDAQEGSMQEEEEEGVYIQARGR